MRIPALIAVLLLAALPALGEVIIEKNSKTEFPTEITMSDAAGAEYALRATGTGLRKKFVFKVYAACFYVDQEVEFDASPQETAINGDFAKGIVMHFLRDVDSNKIAGAFTEGIRKTLAEGHDEAVDAFAAMFSEKVMKGETIELDYLPGSGLSARQAGADLGRIDDPAVIAAIWATWFGEKPISGDLKHGLLGL
jgi:hypothetical protein